MYVTFENGSYLNQIHVSEAFAMEGRFSKR